MQLWQLKKDVSENTLHDSWSSLKTYTAARIALGRTGTSVPLKESFDFKLAHAHARDAVYSSLDIDKLCQDLRPLNLPVLRLKSRVRNRQEYLQRPDLGRQLNIASSEQLKQFGSNSFDIAVIVADGLSAEAINAHACYLLQLLVPKLYAAGLTIAPIIIAENARVAIADETGELLRAKMSVILIGERPGLSSANSMGAYLTWSPKPGLTDEARNCVSNIRPEGLSYQAASDRIFYLIGESSKRKLSGVKLKEETGLLRDNSEKNSR